MSKKEIKRLKEKCSNLFNPTMMLDINRVVELKKKLEDYK